MKKTTHKAQNDIVNYIKDNISIEDVSNRLSLHLHKQGNTLVGNCPTNHPSKSETSFHVNIKNNLCYCFNCGEGGSVIDLVMLTKNCDFKEALNWFGEQYNLKTSFDFNISLTKTQVQIDEEKKSILNSMLYEKLLEEGKVILFQDKGKEALEYLTNSRNFDKTIIKQTELFYLPTLAEAKQILYKHFPDNKSQINELKLVGYFGDNFRLAFPYRNKQGLITGFVKRATKPHGLSGVAYDGKSFTDQRFDSTPGLKKEDLFGLSKVEKQDTIVIVEGYMDATYLYELGVKNIVAVGQGLLAKTHLDGLKQRSIKNVVISFDNDDVGPKNTLSAIELLLRETDINVFVLNPTDFGICKDPDEYVRANGIEALNTLLKNVAGGAGWAVEHIIKTNGMGSELNKAQTLEKVKEFTKLVKNIIDRDKIIDIIRKYFNYNKSDLKKLIGDYTEQTNKNNGLEMTGEFWSCSIEGISLNINEYIKFLQKAGYSKYYLDNDYIFVKTENNIVKECSLSQIKDFIIDYIKGLSDDELNSREQLFKYMLDNQSKYFSEGLIECISTIDINFKRDTKNSASLYFGNGYVTISKNGNPIFDTHKTLESPIWKSSINKRNVDLMKVKTIRSEYEQFLWNVSDRNDEKFLSMCSVIGYMIHDYKEESNAKAIVFYDGKIPTNGEPNGRTGKSLIGKAIEKVKEVVRVDGKNFDFKPTFTFQMVKPSTKIIDFNDVKSNFDFERLFSVITDGMTIEYKNKTPFEIPFAESPKIMISTNYTIKGIGSSYKDRMFEIEFSDYYNPEHKPKDDFGHDFFTDWTDEEWNAFFNFIIECVQLYLDEGLIGCENVNIGTRKLMDETSEQFVEFADSFIDLDKEYDLKDLYSKFKDQLGYEGDIFDRCPIKQNTFTGYLPIYARFKHCEYKKRSSNGKQLVKLC